MLANRNSGFNSFQGRASHNSLRFRSKTCDTVLVCCRSDKVAERDTPALDIATELLVRVRVYHIVVKEPGTKQNDPLARISQSYALKNSSLHLSLLNHSSDFTIRPQE